MAKRNLEFNYSIGEEIDNLIILDRFRIASTGQKAYEYRCKKCGNKDIIIEGNLNKAIGTASGGCNVCHGKKVLKGYNDIATTDPWMVKYFEEKGHKVIHSHIDEDLNFFEFEPEENYDYIIVGD